MINLLSNEGSTVTRHRGWSRRVVSAEYWYALGEMLRNQSLALLGLWGDHGSVHAAVLQVNTQQDNTHEVAVFSLAVMDNRIPSLAAAHPPALRLERAIQDLYGIEVVNLPDRRPWLDHGRWELSAPLAAAPGPAQPYTQKFLTAEGPNLHQIPVGPVHAGIIEPGHFRFTAHGETVVRLEERLGYVHKGIDSLMAGKDLTAAARLAGRVSGDSTVAYAWAFARAVEHATGTDAPPRAVYLRAIMAELERLANHLGDIGAVCNDAAFSLMHAECTILREHTLRAAMSAFGHRLMMDRIVPGGVSADMSEAGHQAIRLLLATIRNKFPELVELYDNTASLQDRMVGTGYVSPSLVAEYACGGFVGRASGREFDTRKHLSYAPYDALPLEVPVYRDGDVDARVRIRIAEVESSLGLVQHLLDALPLGPFYTHVSPPAATVESTAAIEGFRGDVLAYVRLDTNLRIERCHLRDPSWFQWPLLEAAIEGNIVADFPLCNKSFNCSYSGHDL